MNSLSTSLSLVMLLYALFYSEDDNKVDYLNGNYKIVTKIEFIKDHKTKKLNTNQPTSIPYPESLLWKINYWSVSDVESNYLGFSQYSAFKEGYSRINRADVRAFDSVLYNKDTLLTIIGTINGDPEEIRCETVTPAKNAVYSDGLNFDVNTASKYTSSLMRRKRLGYYSDSTMFGANHRITNAFIRVDNDKNIKAYLQEASGKTIVLSWKENIGWKWVDSSM